MTTINQLSAVDTVSAGDLVPIFSTNNGDARKAAMSVIQSFILDNFVEDLTQSTEAIVDADLFAMYDISQANSVKVTAALVYPIVLGRGKRLFDDDAQAAAFRLAGTRATPTGVIVSRYEREGDVRTGSFAAG